MKKKLFSIIMCVLMVMCFMPTAAFATDGATTQDTSHVASVTTRVDDADVTVYYDTLPAAINAARYAKSDATIKMLQSVENVKWADEQGRGTEQDGKFMYKWIVENDHTVTIDLNGKTISLAKGGSIWLKNGTLKLTGTGTIKESDNYRAPITVSGSNDKNKSSYSTLIVEEGVTLEGYTGIQVRSMNSSATDEEGYAYGINITVKGKLIGHRDAEDSTDLGAGIEVKSELNATEGNVPNITLEGATIQADGTGIYAGGYAVWNLKNATEGNTISVNAPTAMCIKSGKFTIDGGEYYSNAGAKDVENLAAKIGSIDTGAVINIINQPGYAGNIDVTINGGKFVSASGHAIYQGTVDNAESDAKLVIKDGYFSGAKEALYLESIQNKGVVEEGIFSSDPTEYLVADKDKRVTSLDMYYVSKDTDEIRTNTTTSALNQGITIAEMSEGTKYQVNKITEWNGQKVTITVAPELHEENGKIGKWVGIAVPVPKENNNSLSYKLSSGEKTSGATIGEGEIGTSAEQDVIVKKITIGENDYIGFYWDYDDKVVNWIKYKFSADDSQDQYNQVFVDITAVPASITSVINHKVGKDACVYDVEYDSANGVATVNYCGLGNDAQAIVKVPVEYQAKGGEDTYLYFKYNDADDWTMMGKGKLDEEDGTYYEYCYINLKDKNEVTLQYKYGPVAEANESGIYVDPVQSGVYTLKVVANEVDKQTVADENHSWDNGEITKEKNAAGNKIVIYTCTICGATKTGEHTHDIEAVNGQAATCTTDGYNAYYECSKCGDCFEDVNGNTPINDLTEWKTTLGQGKIAKNGHNLQKTDEVPATCTTDGNKTYWKCSVCNKYFKDDLGTTEYEEKGWVEAATGHALTPVEAKAATCTTTGTKAYWTCQNAGCGKHFESKDSVTPIDNFDTWKVIAIDANAHDLEKVEAKAPTYSADGNEEYYKCKNGCGKYFSDAAGTKEIEKDSWVIPKLTYAGGSAAQTELEKAKTEAKAEVKAQAEANKYDETEAAEVKAIKDQADKDITAAKTVDEVNKIKAEAEAKIDAVNTAEENAEVKLISGVDSQVFKAWSKKSTLHGKKAIKVSWKLPEGVSVDGFEVYRSTSRYSGYGTEPYFTTKNTTYKNNKDLKSGKTYYYKIRGYKMINGEKIYTGWSTKAYRTIK